jgi:UDP-N-acetylglucosamine--N-acetylmuramyl-(pentapeptide) pyrophosphoryl-undecaprenol N-acetylglucosamine transferase
VRLGVLTGIPVAIQEQNSYPGLTTRWLSRFARQVHLGFPEAEGTCGRGSGRRSTSTATPSSRRTPGSTGRRPARRSACAADSTVVLVVGGSQGARAVNEALAGRAGAGGGGAAERPESLEILWATGPTHIDAVQERLAPLGL